MKIGEMCTRGVVCITHSASLREVAEVMSKRHVGSLVVLSKLTPSQEVVGIITDRDIVRAQLEHVADLSRVCVADVMSAAPFTLRDDVTLEEAIEQMRARGVRRAPVACAQGNLIGFVSTDDILTEIVRQLAALARLIEQQPRHSAHYIS